MKKEIIKSKHLRAYFLVVSILHPVVGFSLAHLLPQEPSFIEERILLFIFGMVMIIPTYFSTRYYSFFPLIAVIFSYICAINWFWLLFQSNFSFLYIAGTMQILAALSPFFATEKSFVLFYSFLFFIFGAGPVFAGEIDPDLIQINLIGVFIMAVFCYYALYCRLAAEKFLFEKSQMREKIMSERFARISHDLKSPLIYLNAQLLNLSRESDPIVLKSKIEELVQRHRVRSSVVIEMMRDLRRISGFELKKTPQKVDLKKSWEEVCQRILEMSSVLRLKKFKSYYRGDEIILLVNKGDLDRILENLIKNAAEAMSCEGEIILTIRKLNQGRAFLDVTNSESEISSFTYSSLQKKDQISTKEFGSGLGLQIVRHITGEYDGQIDIKYQDSRFSVLLDFPLAN